MTEVVVSQYFRDLGEPSLSRSDSKHEIETDIDLYFDMDFSESKHTASVDLNDEQESLSYFDHVKDKDNPRARTMDKVCETAEEFHAIEIPGLEYHQKSFMAIPEKNKDYSNMCEESSSVPASLSRQTSASISVPQVGNTRRSSYLDASETTPDIDSSNSVPTSFEGGSEAGSTLPTNSVSVSSFTSSSFDRKSTPSVSDFIPRILRNSFSKLIHRRGSMSKSPSCHDNDEDFDRRSSHCSIVSPINEEMVKDSLSKGLPIIPFAFPTFFIADKKMEASKQSIRKNSVKEFLKSNESENCDVTREENNSENMTINGRWGLENEGRSCNDSQENSNETLRQSSYVEMNPAEAESQLSCIPHKQRSSMWDEEPYMKMNCAGQLEEESIFHLEEGSLAQKRNYKNPVNSNYFQSGESTGMKVNTINKRGNEIRDLFQSNEKLGRQYRKGNKHKRDYVFLDFEKNKDYVDMKNSNKNKKWQLLKFSSTT